MIELLIWFQTNYPELKKALQLSNHNFDDRDTNPYHIEGDCWSHTMLVCKIAELEGYDRVVQVSALLHDIGKPNSRTINIKNNHVQFFNHEEISAKMAEPLVDDLVERGMLKQEEVDEVLELIRLHTYFYKEYNQDVIYEKFKGRAKLFKHLLELRKCDDMGRFTSKVGTFELDETTILKKLNFCIQ
jgi:tRNA nucleotidyltransferase (CCA-adding enzyme)